MQREVNTNMPVYGVQLINGEEQRVEGKTPFSLIDGELAFRPNNNTAGQSLCPSSPLASTFRMLLESFREARDSSF